MLKIKYLSINCSKNFNKFITDYAGITKCVRTNHNISSENQPNTKSVLCDLRTLLVVFVIKREIIKWAILDFYFTE